ncbi:efflux RND transporter periplasmic adaptor subunit [Eleftheria terrae]|uniref:efflux RND transporter periplasmic adaptor subunit n=1 Tax=Eleftheria terrae TaxID=1597781 RepID=UPI00263B6F7D|nr:efflux RND transporter periplasmic adaptor subunit [Eleftheria terrae]WKB54534.1 efflux RND transporter periplasmic adaptor subunit [Eleftheria terrae]
MKLNKQILKPALIVGALVLGAAVWLIASQREPAEAATAAKPSAAAASAAQGKAALTVTTTTPRSAAWAQTLAANGNVAPWEEAAVGPETGGLRLVEVNVNVGDKVKRGQVLARLSSDTVEATLAQTRAALAEADANLAEAQANAERARQLQTTGAISAQQINQYLTAEQTARARVQAQRAALKSEELRLSQTRILAPDDGVISKREAAVGSIAQPGQELFRLIRRGRLEWRAEVTDAELARLAPGLPAALLMPDGSRLEGKVRMVAPTIDPQSRNAIVYVDLPPDPRVRAGMFARGEFELGHSTAMSLPQSAVLLRDGFQYVLQVGPDSRVVQTKVATGRRQGDRIEVLGGLPAQARVVATGGGFLSDGDLVKVVPEGTALAASSASSPAR